LLREEFHSHGIYLAYDFGILDSNENEFRLVKSANKKELKNSLLTASLFPNDILGNSLSLIVNFPDKNQFLIKQVWASLFTSFVFILIIIGTFSYVVYKIIHQKKLADLKNDFINNMTHEFKTPIATVSLASEALLEEKVYSSQETMLRYIGVIQEESKRLGLQVEKVLQLASMDRDNLNLNMKSCSLRALIESALDRARFQVEERDGDISVNLPHDDITILADEMHFSNAIFNLLDNAIKYSKNGPQIDLAVSVNKSKLVIEVRDQGIGLTQEQQKHIFDKFYRVPKGNVHDVKGFGLGLNYVKYIIDGHDGEINVESQLNKGSRFRISIPMIND
jgi:two-component system phosphate regulon sensor histidine kinase PhoR